MAVLNQTVARRLEHIVTERMRTEPVIVLHGPRSVGKSTLLGRVAEKFGRPVMDLDDPLTRDLVSAGPGFVVQGDGPVFIDEYQRVPEILDAIKAELNKDLRPGRFVVTGSTSYTSIPRAAQSLTGRAHVITVWPLSQGEISGAHESFVARLLADPAAVAHGEPSATDRLGYAERVLNGGFPIPLRRQPGRARDTWFGDYLDLVVQRDVLDIRRIRQRDVLPRLLRRLAAQTGQIVNIAHAARAERLEPSAANDYAHLLEAVFLVHRLPAWGTTLSARVNTMPKIHMVDTGVGGWLLDVTMDSVERRVPSTLTELGHLVETFAVNELLKQVSWLDDDVRVGHYRTHDGHEIDLVLQLRGGDALGIEVKAGERVTRADTVSLARLRDKLGTRFRGGFILHTGPHTVPLADGIFAVPLDRLWA
ncbi:MAG: ATP-binding protein [Pseudonocardiales bacterium]